MKLLDAYKVLHSSPKSFPGFSIKHHLEDIKILVDSTGAKTLLDFGCGKGYQYLGRRYHDYWGGILPTCFDPAVTHLDFLQEGSIFDGVICTDVAEHVPEDEVCEFLSKLFSHADKFVFLSIATFKARKTMPDGSNCHCTVKTDAWWMERVHLQSAGKLFKVVFRRS